MGIIGSFEGYTTSPLYLFNNGIWNGLQITGVVKTAEQNMGNGKTFIKISSTNQGKTVIDLSASTAQYWVLGRLNQSINLSTYNFIRLKINAHNFDRNYPSYGILGISDNPNLTSTSFIAQIRFFESDVLLDISSVAGNYYIYFYTYTSFHQIVQLYLTGA